jgi:hypothetical protein
MVSTEIVVVRNFALGTGLFLSELHKTNEADVRPNTWDSYL